LSVLWERDELCRHLALERRAQRVSRVVLANGCFDLLHVGHVRYLEEAKARGDCLVVALNSDASVRALKGMARPFVTLRERAELIGALRAVDYVIAFDEETLEESLRSLRPDVHAKGTDYTTEDVPERAVDAELGIELVICGDPKRRSSTAIAARLVSESVPGEAPSLS